MATSRRRAAFVTGVGRSIGIGAAIARALAGDGIDVCIGYWHGYDATMPWGADAAVPDGLLADLRDFGGRADAISADLANAQVVEGLLDEVERRIGPLTILINNAAYSTSGGYETLTAAEFDAHYVVNARATALLSAQFLRRWPGGAGGRIVNMTSGQSQGAMPDELAYVASKGAVEALTTSLAPAAMAMGVTVNAVNPGPTDTGWMTDELRQALRAQFPSGRIGEPEDAARLVRFLVSSEAEWITGQVIHSEGGFWRR